MDCCRVVGPRGLCRPLDEKQGFPTNTSPFAPWKGCSKAEQSRTTFREKAGGGRGGQGQGRQRKGRQGRAGSAHSAYPQTQRVRLLKTPRPDASYP